MRILCLCEGGSCRSVALAFLLKNKYGQDAIAAGWRLNTFNTLEMLYNWSDMIICLETYMKEKIDPKFHNKVSVMDVGPDRFFQINKELLNILDEMIQKCLVKTTTAPTS